MPIGNGVAARTVLRECPSDLLHRPGESVEPRHDSQSRGFRITKPSSWFT
jgi:hypothetical protein